MHDPMNLSSELLKYLGKTAGTQMTKSEAMKLVSNSVREAGLQNTENSLFKLSFIFDVKIMKNYHILL